jgi:NAD(P)-dependent dehydrogenase (short-subunit alcohol dehydrogenase family)
MRLGAKAAIVGRTLERLQSSAKELSEKTGMECLPLQADVRKYAELESAASKTVEKFGKIDFVICGAYTFSFFTFHLIVTILVLVCRRCWQLFSTHLRSLAQRLQNSSRNRHSRNLQYHQGYSTSHPLLSRLLRPHLRYTPLPRYTFPSAR